MLALQQAQEEILRMQSDFDLHCGELERRAVDAEQRLELKNVLCLKLDVDLKRSEAALQALYPELNLLRAAAEEKKKLAVANAVAKAAAEVLKKQARPCSDADLQTILRNYNGGFFCGSSRTQSLPSFYVFLREDLASGMLTHLWQPVNGKLESVSCFEDFLVSKCVIFMIYYD